MAINKEVRVELQKKFPGLTKRRIDQVIVDTQKKYRIVDRDIAGYVLAFEKKINLKRYLKPELIEKVQEAMQRGPGIIESINPNNGKKSTYFGGEKKDERSPYDLPLSKYNLDPELIADCKIQKPYRKAVSEALLTLETRIRDRLNLDETYYGAHLITEAHRQEVFKRRLKAEEEGLYMLFMGGIKWLRNPSGHRKILYSKEEAYKVVLFADHLIKLFEDLVNHKS